MHLVIFDGFLQERSVLRIQGLTLGSPVILQSGLRLRRRVPLVQASIGTLLIPWHRLFTSFDPKVRFLKAFDAGAIHGDESAVTDRSEEKG